MSARLDQGVREGEEWKQYEQLHGKDKLMICWRDSASKRTEGATEDQNRQSR